MSETSGRENDKINKTSGTPQENVEHPPLRLTVHNVQRLEVELGLGRLYDSSQSLEAYLKNSGHLLGETSQGSSKAFHEGHRSLSRTSSPSASPEYVDILGVDGTVFTRASRSTQTDWNWVSQRHEQSICSRQTEENVPEHDKKSPQEQEEHKGLDSESQKKEMVEMEIIEYNEEAAAQSRALQVSPQVEHLTGKFDKNTILTSSSDSSVLLPKCELPTNLCEYCRQEEKPPVIREQLEKITDPEEVAWRIAVLSLKEKEEEEEAFKFEQESTKINEVGAHPFPKTESKERAGQRLSEWEFMRSQGTNNSALYARQEAEIISTNTIGYRLSNDLWNNQEESQLPEMEIITPPETLTLPDREPGVKRKNILVRYYRNGKRFVLIFPDGTGHVFYPSGRIAVLITSVDPGHFIYVILEDAPLLPNIQAIFTSRGQATCYHPNGLICVSLTRLGGTWCTETGALKRRWSWMDLSTHVHAPPFQPVTMTLSPYISIRICTQENIHLTFTAGKNSVHFNMGAKLKVENTKALMLPGPDTLESYLHKKGLQIFSLLKKLQGSISLKWSEPGLIKSQYSLLAQCKRLKRQAKKQRPSKKPNYLRSSKK